MADAVPDLIRFRCRCGAVLQAAASTAGSDVQCRRCGWLVSVPELPDLERIEDDGTFRLADDAGAGQKQPVDVPNNWDHRGIDRRQTLEQILRTGISAAEPAAPHPERFDPETGELIREFELAEPGRQVRAPARPRTELLLPAPLAAAGLTESPTPAGPALTPKPPQPAAAPPPTLAYAAGAPDYARLVAGQAPIPLKVRPVFFHNIVTELFQPANVLVVVIVFGAHILVQGMTVLTLMGALPMALIAGWIWLTLLAHYVNVIDETGPERRDELPSVMRNVHFSEDFLRPLFALLLAAVICFGPAAYIAREFIAWRLGVLLYGTAAGAASASALAAVAAAAALAIAGFLCFPAVLLTAATSGVYLNLAPHRVLGVVRAAPIRYVIGLALLAVAIVSYAAALTAMGYLCLAGAGWTTPSSRQLLIAAAVAYPALFAAVYFSHWFAWSLGKTYQDYHESFGWVWQRHISSRMDATRQLERMKAAQLRAQQEERLRQAQQLESRLAPP